MAAQTRTAVYSEVISNYPTIKILKTGEASAAADADAKKLEEKLRTIDMELFRILLALLPDDPDGQRATTFCSSTVTSEYKHGSFIQAWQKLIKVYGGRSKTVLNTLKKQYLDLEMGEEDDPFEFVMKMSELRKLMRDDHKHTIKEEDYLQDILEKLPNNYRAKKSEIKTAIKDGEVKDETDMILTLGEEFGELFPAKAETGTILMAETKGDTALFGQFKGKCDHCGKWGHK